MRARDISIIVRDKNLVKKGTITSKYLSFEAHPVWRGAGWWKLTLPKNHPMVPHLATPGSGILVSLYGNPYFSGFTTKPEELTNIENPDGTYTFTGFDDTALLFRALAFPQPSNPDPTNQTVTNDSRTGDAETLMHGYVHANIGVSAPPGRVAGLRAFLATSTNEHRGPTVTKSPRFQNLGALLQEIGILANLGFRVIQRGTELVFEVIQPVDRSGTVLLSVQSGSLTSTSLQQSAPNVTRVIVGGKGEGVDRLILQRTTPESEAAEDEWGQIIEEFVSYTNSDDPDELAQTGDERLLEDGFTATAVKAIPADDQSMRFSADWDLGDTVGLVAYGQRTQTVVTEAAILVNKDRVAVGVGIGDLRNFDPKNALESRVEDTAKKVSKIERTLELGAKVQWGDIQNKPTVFPPNPASTVYDARYYTETEVQALLAALVPAGNIEYTARSSAPSGWLLCDGSAVSRTTYATLFAAIGTTYGAGNGSTTFNLPDLKGRVPVGRDSGQTEFDVLGETGGAKTHLLTAAQSGLRAHTHTPNSTGQYVLANGSGGPGGTANVTTGGGGYVQTTLNNAAAQNATEAHNNLQPYIVLNAIIKT